MPTTIFSNGSKWAFQAPDTVEDLLAVLAKHPLNRSFEEPDPAAAFITVRSGGIHRFFGNFLTVSHVFQIESDEPEIIEKLTAAIRANQQRPDYLSQPDGPTRVAARKAEQEARDRQRREAREADARRTLASLKAEG